MIAIDVGSGYTQYTTGNTKNEGYFPSIVAPCPDILGFREKEPSVVEFDGKSFLIGWDADNLADSEKDFFCTLTDGWVLSDPWFALFYAAIASSGILNDKGDNEVLNLVTGVPQGQYLSHSSKVVKALDKKHSFVFKEVPYTVNIKPVCIPQAAGPVFYASSKDKNIFNYDVGIIDIGTYTTGLSLIANGGHFKSRNSESYPIGVSNLLNKIRDFVYNNYGSSIPYNKSINVLESKSIRVKGKDIDLSNDISKLTFSLSEELLEGVKTKWDSRGMNYEVFVAGGGAPFFIETIKTVVPHAKVMDDSFFAVVRGMLIYLNANIKKIPAL